MRTKTRTKNDVALAQFRERLARRGIKLMLDL